jgi:hypothetical protein
MRHEFRRRDIRVRDETYGETRDREVISMWALGVFAGLVGATTLAWYIAGRDNVPPMERHLRAIDALRDLSEHPRPAQSLVEPPPELPSEHIRILPEAPIGSRPNRRSPSRRPGAAATRARSGARRTTKSRAASSTPMQERPTIEIRPVAARIPAAPAFAAIDTTTPAPSRAGTVPPENTTPENTTPEPARPDGAEHRWSPARIDRLRAGSPRAYAAIGSAVVVVIVVLLVALALGARHGSGAAAKAAAVPAPTSAAPTSTSTPPTTAPVQAAPVVARSGNGATISVRSPFQITLHAVGTCWVEVTDPTGRTLFNQTLHSGQEQLIPGATPIVVRLGYTPAMSISVDGVGIDLAGLSQTANLNFQTD